jgi:uncharacterized protein (TIGR02246 family)
MKTTDELVRDLADREAIRDLPVRYCDCLQRKDVDGLLGLFTDDATFVIKGVEVEAVSRGRAEIRRTHEKAVAETNPRLFVHTQIVNLLGVDRATGRCSVEVRNVTLTMEWLGLGYFGVAWPGLLRGRVCKSRRPVEVHLALPQLRRTG